LNIPTVIHEQNSIAGVTNKFLARFVDKIAISFPDAANEFPEKRRSS
jgi:UDP-N-acetylglucosamine:LPS N-acetylglucosamine transferase